LRLRARGQRLDARNFAQTDVCAEQLWIGGQEGPSMDPKHDPDDTLQMAPVDTQGALALKAPETLAPRHSRTATVSSKARDPRADDQRQEDDEARA
jgi:hypothetical protein